MRLKSLREDTAFKEMAAEIRTLSRGKKVVYVANVGNWGDGLIHKGNEQFLRANNVD